VKRSTDLSPGITATIADVFELRFSGPLMASLYRGSFPGLFVIWIVPSLSTYV
jgi:hypothetical protein